MLNDVLVSGLEHGFYDFPCIGNVIIPIDFHIFQGLKPPKMEDWFLGKEAPDAEKKADDLNLT
jgi:hypothetical protein